MIWRLSSGALAAAAVLAAGGAWAGTASFKDWTVVCDNVRDCTAFGFAEEGAETNAFLKITRSAAANAPPVVEAAVEGATAPVWSLSIDGRALAGLEALKAAPGQDNPFARASLSRTQGGALIAALVNGAALTVRPGAGAPAAISLAGSSAALRWMDDQQKRAGTVTALAAKGPRPASDVPPAPPVPLIRRGRVPSQAGVGEALPKSVRARFGADCDQDIPQDMRDPISARLAPGVILWGDVCANAAYQSAYSLFLADEKGGHVRPLLLDDGLGGKPDNQPIGVEFDLESLTLSNFYKGRGIADCGQGNSWTWDGAAFRLSAQSVMTECRGLPPEDWPVSFVSRDR